MLSNEEFCNQIKRLSLEINDLDLTDISKWEWFKFQVREQAIITGKKISLARKSKQKEWLRK